MKNRTRKMVDEVCSGKIYDFDDLQKDLLRKHEAEMDRIRNAPDVDTDVEMGNTGRWSRTVRGAP